MLRTYVAQQRQLLHMARKITLPQTDCREGSPRCPFSSGSSVSSGSAVSSGSSVSPCAPLACDSRSSFSLDTSVLTAAAKACLVGQLRLVGSSVSSCAPSACDTGSSYSSDSSVLRAAVKALHRASLPAVPSYQRRPSSPRNREGNVRFPTNLHGVGRSGRPTSR